MVSQHESQVAREEFLSFRLGDEEYAIDILKVQEIRAHEAVTRIANAPGYLKGVINLRGQIVAIVDLRVKLSMARVEVDASTVVIILNIAGRVIGMVVDAVSDVVALAPDQVRPAPVFGNVVDASFIRGIAPVEDRMLILVDIARLMTSGELAVAEKAAA
ncbi:MAG TPA: chemotaxis protein CheW [Usitatibacter sp.]|nr:chemotaxis protein CheW [Usitatibacter sp.]